MQKCPLAVLLAGLLIVSCGKDPAPSETGQKNLPWSRSSCALSMHFEAESTRMLRPVHQADMPNLDRLDSLMMLPKRERWCYDVCIKPDGTTEVVMTSMTPLSPLTRPASGVAEGQYDPGVHKIITTNGIATFYDVNDAVINTLPDDDLGYSQTDVLDMVEALQQNAGITDQQFDQVLQTLINQGAQIHELPNDMVSMRFTLPDGAVSTNVFNRKNRLIVGHTQQDATGKLQFRSAMRTSGTTSNPIVESSYWAAFIKSVDGTIPMKLEILTDYDHFSFTNQ